MSAALEAYVDYALYVEAKIDIDEMPFTFAQWWEIEQRIRGDQLTLTGDVPAGLLADT